MSSSEKLTTSLYALCQERNDIVYNHRIDWCLAYPIDVPKLSELGPIFILDVNHFNYCLDKANIRY